MIREPRPRSARWLSTSIPEAQWQGSLARTSSAEYNVNNLVSPVLFQEALWHVPADAVVLEIAPHGLLQVRLGVGQGPRRPLGVGRAPRVREPRVCALWARAGGAGRTPPTSAHPPQGVLKRGLQSSCTVIPLMKKDHEDNLRFFLSNVGRLHLLGWVCAPAPRPLPGRPPIVVASGVSGGTLAGAPTRARGPGRP